jgi:hypothetical protein
MRTSKPRQPRVRTTVSVLAAIALVGGGIALSKHYGRPLRFAQVDDAVSAVTATTGPLAANAVLQQGPGYGYPAAGNVKPFTTYAVQCFSAPGIPAGQTGPYPSTDLSTVWYLLADAADSAQGIGYLLATDLVSTSAGLDQIGRCATDPPLPAGDSNAPAIGPAKPDACPRGFLGDGLNTINVHSSTGSLDIEFLSSGLPETVTVQDKTTDDGMGGVAILDPGGTYYFKEDQNTLFGDHELFVTVSAALGGPAGEEPADGDAAAAAGPAGNGAFGEEEPADGDTADGDVMWEAISSTCVQLPNSGSVSRR